MSETVSIKQESLDALRQKIKDQQYIIRRMTTMLGQKDEEIDFLKQFPDEALKAAAQKILSDKNLRRESMKRWKSEDEE